MPRAITLRRVGGSVGTTLPKEMVDRLDLAAGDRVLAIETDQGILLTPYTEDLDADLAATRRAAKRYRVALRELGGGHGLRDEDALESGLARPRQRWHHDPEARLADLAAAYAFGLARNHPYVDGNKRIALVAMVAFLDRNGVALTATNSEAASTMLAVASGEISEPELADWVEARCPSA